MLPEPLRLLISAFAVGEVTARQRTAALRLLHHSAEARTLLRDLKANSRRLSALPRQALPHDFVDRVLRDIPGQRPIIRSTALSELSPPRLSRATRSAAAASVLLAVGVAWYMVAKLPTDSVGFSQRIPTATDRSTVPVDRAQITSPIPFEPDQGIDTLPPELPITSAQAVVQALPAPPSARPRGALPLRPPDVLGTNSTSLPKFVEVDAPLLTLPVPLRELVAADRPALVRELSRADTRRIDLFCRDTVRAFERLQAVCRNRGVHLVIEPVAQEALKRKRPGWFVVYADSLTAAEWAQLLQLLGTADRQAEQRRLGDGLFDQVVLLPFTAAEQRDLSALVGSDPTRLTEPRRTESPAGHEKMGLVLPYSLRPAQGSREVRQYLDGRGDRGPGTVAVMLVLR